MGKAKAPKAPPPKTAVPPKTSGALQKSGRAKQPHLETWADKREGEFWKRTFSDHDYKILTKVWKRAHRLDTCFFSSRWFRFGWSSVIGCLPVIGDTAEVVSSARLIQKCNKVEGGLPKWTAFLMVWRVILDLLLGLVPIIGDLIDVGYKANTSNALRLERHLCEKYGVDEETGERLDGSGRDLELGPVAVAAPAPAVPRS